MATLNIKVNGKTDTCTLYSTKAEAGDNSLSVKVGGKLAYAAMTTDLADSEITKIRVKKNGTVYAVLKEAEPKQITCVLTIGYLTDDQIQESKYGYVNAPPSATYPGGDIEPKTFLGDEFVGIEASENNMGSTFFQVGVGSNPKKHQSGNWYDFENANHAYIVEIPQFNFTIKAGKGYTDNEFAFGTTYIKMAMPSTAEQKRMVNLFKANAGKSVKVILTVISPPANTDTKN